MIKSEDEDKLCTCGYPGFDHGLWMGLARLAQVEKTRRVGCRVISCGCEEWKSAFEHSYEKWDIGEG